MNIEKAGEQLSRWGKKLLETGIVSKASLAISFRNEHTMFFVPSSTGSDAAEKVGAMDIDHFSGKGDGCSFFAGKLHGAIYKKRRDLNVLIHTDQMNILTSCRAGVTVPPLLDDFAQLVGVSAKVVKDQSLDQNQSIKTVIASLKRRNAVLSDMGFAICGGKDFDDALATAQVLEKGCRANIETECLGGGIRINKVEAYLMRLVYQYKYSKLK